MCHSAFDRVCRYVLISLLRALNHFYSKIIIISLSSSHCVNVSIAVIIILHEVIKRKLCCIVIGLSSAMREGGC
jgi:hypothetical protein